METDLRTVEFAFLAAVVLLEALRVGAFLAEDLAGAFLATAFVAPLVLATAFLAAAFLAGDFLAGDFVVTDFLTGDFLAAAVLASSFTPAGEASAVTVGRRSGRKEAFHVANMSSS